MTTNVLPIIKITTPNGQHCNINAYHITMIDYRRDTNGYAYPTVCLSSGSAIAVTEEEANRIVKAISKLDKPPEQVNNLCKFRKVL
jgi:uncharacterized protein YlzI (FlbEa/FlbD family)